MERCPQQSEISQFRLLGGHPLDGQSCGIRLDKFLACHYPFYSRSGWQKKIFAKELLVNTRHVSASYILKRGDQLTFYQPQEKEPEVNRNVSLIWREGGVMAICKPAPLPMHGNGPYRLNTLTHLIHNEFGKEWSCVHRLDLETSGIVLCAANTMNRNRLSEAFFHGQIQKEYLAIVRGVPTLDFWQEHGPIGPLSGSTINIKKWVVPGGLRAETWFSCLKRKNEHSLLKAAPKTGRTNQIRVHAAFKGLPLVGDKLYHPDEAVFQLYFDHGNIPEVAERTGFPRLCLHAAALRFKHPETGTWCEITSPLPEELAKLWDELP